MATKTTPARSTTLNIKDRTHGLVLWKAIQIAQEDLRRSFGESGVLEKDKNEIDEELESFLEIQESMTDYVNKLDRDFGFTKEEDLKTEYTKTLQGKSLLLSEIQEGFRLYAKKHNHIVPKYTLTEEQDELIEIEVE